jgi:alcohol dehydrogenase
MVAENLPRAVSNGSDLEARSQLLFAAHLAGYAFAVTGLGLAHGIGHPLSTRVGTSHGGGLAIVLPHVLRFNLSVRTDAYAQAAFAMGTGSTDRSERSNAHAFIEAVTALSTQVGTAMSLRSVGVTDELVEVLAKDALADVVTNNNPITPSRADVESVIRAALD